MTTDYKRVKAAQRNTEANAIANVKTRENRLAADTKRWISKLEDGTAVREGGYTTRYLERFTNLATALTAFGSSNIDAVLATTLTLTGDTTIPANVALRRIKGGTIALNGFTLTVNGPIVASDDPLFTGTGSVVYGGGKVRDVPGQWRGVTGDGVSDDSAALALAYADSKSIVLGPGDYTLLSTVTRSTNAMNLKGAGAKSRIVVPALATTPGLTFSSIGDIVREQTIVRDLNFDGGSGQALKVETVSPFIGENLRFNTGANSFRMTQSFYGRLTNSSFKVSGIWFDNVNNFQLQGVDMNGGADWTGSQIAYAGRFALSDYAMLLDTCTGVTFANMTMEAWYCKLMRLVNCKKITFDGIWFEQNRGATIFQLDLTSTLIFKNCLMDFEAGSIAPYPVNQIFNVDHSTGHAPARIGKTTIFIKDCDLYLKAATAAANNYLFCKGNSSSYTIIDFEGCSLRAGFINLDQYSTAIVRNMLLTSQQRSDIATVDQLKLVESLPVAMVKEKYNSWVPSNVSANWDFTTGTNGGANLDETTTSDLTITVSTSTLDVLTGSRSAKITIPAAVTALHKFTRNMSDMGSIATEGQTYLVFVRFKTSKSIKFYVGIDGFNVDYNRSYEVQTKENVWVDYVFKTASDASFSDIGPSPRFNFHVTNNSGVDVDMVIDRFDYQIVTGDHFLPAGSGSPAAIVGDYSMRSNAISGNETVGGTLDVTGLIGAATLTASLPVFSNGSKKLVSGTMTGTGDVVNSTSPTSLAGQWAWNSVSSTITLGTSLQTISALNISTLLTGLTGNDQRGISSSPTFNSSATATGRGILTQLRTAAAAFTMVDGMGINILTPSVGAASAITNVYGLKIEDQSGGSNLWSIKTGTGLVDLGDQLITKASTTTRSGIRIPSGSAPSSPVSGDFWYDGTNLKFRDGSTTRTLTWT